jgi:hypothetical protein
VTSSVTEGRETVIEATPDLPSEVAEIDVAPGATGETNPVELTIATALLPCDHVIARPLSAFPPASFAVAVSWTVCVRSIAFVTGVRSTLATATGAVELSPPQELSAAAMINVRAAIATSLRRLERRLGVEDEFREDRDAAVASPVRGERKRMELHEVTARGGQKGVASSAGEVHALRADQGAGWWEVPRFITQCINDLFARQQQQSTSRQVNRQRRKLS